MVTAPSGQRVTVGGQDVMVKVRVVYDVEVKVERTCEEDAAGEREEEEEGGGVSVPLEVVVAVGVPRDEVVVVMEVVSVVGQLVQVVVLVEFALPLSDEEDMDDESVSVDAVGTVVDTLPDMVVVERVPVERVPVEREPVERVPVEKVPVPEAVVDAFPDTVVVERVPVLDTVMLVELVKGGRVLAELMEDREVDSVVTLATLEVRVAVDEPPADVLNWLVVELLEKVSGVVVVAVAALVDVELTNTTVDDKVDVDALKLPVTVLVVLVLFTNGAEVDELTLPVVVLARLVLFPNGAEVVLPRVVVVGAVEADHQQGGQTRGLNDVAYLSITALSSWRTTTESVCWNPQCSWSWQRARCSS